MTTTPRAGWRGGRRAASAGLVLCLLISIGLPACRSDQERAAHHLARAKRFLEEGDRKKARLELENALEREPDNAQAHLAFADLARVAGDFERTLHHLREAHRIAPNDAETTRQLAVMLEATDPEAADALIDELVSREPYNPIGYVGRSELALFRGQTRLALESAKKAVTVAPDDPIGHGQVGRAYFAAILAQQQSGRVPDSLYLSAVAAYSRYIEKGGEDPWLAQLEQARIVAGWPAQSKDASKLFRIALDRMIEEAGPDARLRGAGQAATFARSVGDDELLESALQLIVGLSPETIEAWTALAAVTERRGGSAEDVFQRMMKEQPEDPRVYIEYARHVMFSMGLEEALAFLEEKAKDPSIDPPALYGAIANTQLAAKRPDDAEATIQRLEHLFPGHPRSVLERAQLDLRRGDVDAARLALRKLLKDDPQDDESQHAYRLLALTEEASGFPILALRAINKSIALSTSFSLADQRIRTRLLAARGNCLGTVWNLTAIAARTELSDPEVLMLARCRYERGQDQLAARLLGRIVKSPDPLPAAVLEFARREGAKRPELAKHKLETLLKRNPRNWDALQELTRLEAATGETDAAFRRLSAALQGHEKDDVPARIRLLRAGLHLEAGRKVAALADAQKAFEQTPNLPGALELVVQLYSDAGLPERGIAALDEAQRADAMTAPRYVLLGRLQRQLGHEKLALAAFERALASGSSEPVLKNDVAFLLAKEQRDLRRALRMAQEARTELANDPNAADTLGYVFLRSGKPHAALAQFEDAVGRAEPPRAGFYYHMGLALQSLDRMEEAAVAFKKALSIDGNFPEAAAARRELERAIGAGAGAS